MKKRSKILLGTLLPVSLAGVASSMLFITSCSNIESNGFNEELFKTNDGVRYMDLTNTGISSDNDVMKTTNIANTLLATKDGTSSYVSTYVDQFLVDWFSKTNDSILSTYYNDQLKTIQDEYNDKKNSFTDMNLFQREVLDPTGGTEKTYIYDQLVSKLKQQLSDNLFARDYLGIKSGDSVIKLDSQDAQAKSAIRDANNINGATAGTRNNFVFSEKSVTSANPFDKYYADFVSFIFEEWTKDTLPIITPTVLFKHSTGTSPENSGLFNTVFFGTTALEGTDSSYKFQWFDPATINFSSPNSTMKYQSFVANMDSFINSTTGAINIDKSLTDDSSTMLITNGASCYNDFVTPFAAAAMYNFSSLVFKTSGVASSNLDATSIMKNFLSTDEKNTDGYFTLPYNPTTNAFLADYANTKSVRETFKVTTGSNTETPFIATRDEFGVHIIGIDRYNKIKEAVGAKTGKEAFESAIVEIQNTILWRSAQKIMASGDSNADSISLDLKSTLKSYYDDNASTLIFKYLNSKTSSDTNYLFSSATIKENESVIDLTKTSAEKTLMEAAIKLNKIEKAIEFTNTIKDKMYTLQSSYSSNENPESWKNNGLAGVLPYTRNTTSGNFEQLTDIALKILNASSTVGSSSIESLYTNTKNELGNSIDALQLEAANKTNYFNGDKIGEQLGVSQYEFVNNWNVNQILVKDSSANDVVNLYNQLWDNKNTNENLKQFTTQISNPTTFEQNVANEIIKQIPSNYSISKAFSSSDQKASIGLTYNDFAQLQATSTNWINKQIQDNEVGSQYKLVISNNADFQTFLKTLTWLLTPEVAEGSSVETYSFANLITILNEIIEKEDTGVGYVGWTSESNKYANPTFGTTNTVAQDFSTYRNPVYMTNINTYSYYGAPNPDIKQSNDNIYYGTNQSYFNSAKMKSTDTATSNGFLGFQSSSTSLTSSSLPSELYTGKILTQNTANPNQNFTGLFYRFNEDGNNDNAKNKMKSYYQETNNTYELQRVSNQIRSYGLDILSKTINSPKVGTVLISDALTFVNYGTDLQNNTLTSQERKDILSLIIDQIPSQAFAQLQAQSLYNSDINGNSSKVFMDDTTWNTTQYVVTQFNQTDINNFETWVKETKSKTISNLSFANMDISAFFGAIVLLAQNSEVQSRSSTHWNNIAKEKKIVLYNYLVAQKLGESIVENWDDFK